MCHVLNIMIYDVICYCDEECRFHTQSLSWEVDLTLCHCCGKWIIFSVVFAEYESYSLLLTWCLEFTLCHIMGTHSLIQ